MKYLNTFILIFLIFTIIDLNDGAKPKGSKEEKAPQVFNLKEAKTCNELVSMMVKKQMKAIPVCIKELKFKSSREKQQRSNCVMKCVFITEGLFNSEGYADILSIAAYTLDNIPDFMLGRLLQVMAVCKEKAEGDMVNPDEVSCKTYEPVICKGIK